jgi:N-acetylneuraminate synthase
MTRCLVIAEAGVNHNGSLETGLHLVDVAAEAGADIVKFQTFKAERVVTSSAPKAEYQQRTIEGADSQLAMLRRLELDETMHLALLQRCNERGIEFLSTPFDVESLDFLVKRIGVKRLKVPSGEITNGPLLLAAARSGLPILLSTGMSTLAEIADALQVLAFGMTRSKDEPDIDALAVAQASPEGRHCLEARLTLLHCTTEYPAPFADANLRAIDTMRDAFRLAVGFSDHTSGIVAPLAAVARGALVVEKHFTLDRALPGPDHAASLEPAELANMVQAIRIVETALGSGIKAPALSELKNLAIARRSLVAARPIGAGERFTAENLTAKRPGTGRSPMDYWRLLGTTASRDFAADELIE